MSTSEVARDKPTVTDRGADWPWAFKVQAEALLPEIRDGIVVDALDELSDPDVRAEAIAAEDDLRSASRADLQERLDHA
jgi:hypothetical protein